MKKLLIVDGSNMVMRAAFGGDIAPEQAVPIATGLIQRAARIVNATHLVIALDSPVPSWRKAEFPDYKAHRTVDTTRWLRHAFNEWTRAGFYLLASDSYEADDIIATLANRVAGKCGLAVLSSDSDLLCLTELALELWRPMNGGKFEPMTATEVCAKYSLVAPGQLSELKALTGEKGDNIPGVPGIGPVKAAKLLGKYHNLDNIVLAGRQQSCAESNKVAAHEAIARQALRLTTLSMNAPVPPIQPAACELHTNAERSGQPPKI